MLQVIVVDAHPIIRSGVQDLLKHQSKFRFAGGAASVAEAIPLLRDAPADALMMNIPLPVATGLEQIQQVRKTFPRLGIVVFSALEESVYAESCFRCGANAFLSKRTAVSEILVALEKAARGEMYCSEDLKAHLISRAASGPATQDANPLHLLSHAEGQVFELIGEGKTTGQIAKALGISTKTVETYRTRMKQKLGFRSGAQLTHFAITQMLGHPVPPQGKADG